jgi:hypothetical protein
MRWPGASKLIDKIHKERPELIVDHYALDFRGETYALRVYTILKDQPPDADGMTWHLIQESLDTLYGPAGWDQYKQKHPEPWCPPEQSYHTDALGREVDHRG